MSVNTYSQASSWTYYANGWLQSQTLGNGVTTTHTPNALGQTTDLLTRTGGATPATLSDYTAMRYDGAGNRVSVTAAAPSPYPGVTSYQYDGGQTANPALNRSQLTQEGSTRTSPSYLNAFAYDGGASGGPGNPTSFKGAANTFNADNQTSNVGYGYDGEGNPTAYKGVTLAYDPEDRLTSYGTLQTDGYDGDGLRAWKQKGAARTYFLYDGTQPVGEYGSTGSLAASNTFGAGGLLSRQVSAGPTYYAFDERGDVSQRTNGAGAVSGSDLYDGYGARTGTVATQPDPFGYGGQAGYYTDVETGLILCTHRFYDPSGGRWLTRDPMGYRGGLNLYGYTRNNPSNSIDPAGLGPIAGPGATITTGAGGDGVTFTYYPPPAPSPLPPQDGGFYYDNDGSWTQEVPPGQGKNMFRWRWDPGSDEEPCHYDYREGNREWRYFPEEGDPPQGGWQPKPGGLNYEPVPDGNVPRPPSGPPFRTSGSGPVNDSGEPTGIFGGGAGDGEPGPVDIDFDPLI